MQPGSGNQAGGLERRVAGAPLSGEVVRRRQAPSGRHDGGLFHKITDMVARGAKEYGAQYVGKLAVSAGLDSVSLAAGVAQWFVPGIGDGVVFALGLASAGYIKAAYNDDVAAGVSVGEQFPVLGRIAWALPTCTWAHLRHYHSDELHPALNIGLDRRKTAKPKVYEGPRLPTPTQGQFPHSGYGVHR